MFVSNGNLKLLFFSYKWLQLKLTNQWLKNQSDYEPLNLENVSFLNSDNFDATDFRF